MIWVRHELNEEGEFAEVGERRRNPSSPWRIVAKDPLGGDPYTITDAWASNLDDAKKLVEKDVARRRATKLVEDAVLFGTGSA